MCGCEVRIKFCSIKKILTILFLILKLISLNQLEPHVWHSLLYTHSTSPCLTCVFCFSRSFTSLSISFCLMLVSSLSCLSSSSRLLLSSSRASRRCSISRSYSEPNTEASTHAQILMWAQWGFKWTSLKSHHLCLMIIRQRFLLLFYLKKHTFELKQINKLDFTFYKCTNIYLKTIHKPDNKSWFTLQFSNYTYCKCYYKLLEVPEYFSPKPWFPLLRFSRNWNFDQDNDSKHASKLAKIAAGKSLD